MRDPAVDLLLVTERRYERPAHIGAYEANILEEDRLLGAALARLGLTHRRVDWARPEVDWSRARGAVLRTTWDYFERLPEFRAWIERAAAATRLFNPPELLRWNVDKHYLLDLERRGLAIVPTRISEPVGAAGTAPLLEHWMDAAGWDEVVLKPAVSGAARHTWRFSRARAPQHQAAFAALLRDEAMLLQPFQPAVLETGELSLVVIAGRCTHAVRKLARPGDFRVQDDHGGTVHPHAPDVAERRFAEACAAACSPAPLYARVDAVRDGRGALLLMELELVEPELFFRVHPPAAAALAEALARALEG